MIISLRLLLLFIFEPCASGVPEVVLQVLHSLSPDNAGRIGRTHPYRSSLLRLKTFIVWLCPLKNTDMCNDITLTELFPVHSYSLFKYVPRCIIVSYDSLFAVWTNPHSIRQLKICILVTAVIAYLRGRKEASCLDTYLPVEHTLIVNLTIDFSESCIL